MQKSSRSLKTMINYRDIICIFCLLCYLLITSSSLHSFLRNVAYDFSTILQQEGPHKSIGIEISSRDDKVLLSSTVKGMRDLPPSSYSLKMESFNTLLKSTYAERYESRPFLAGGYNWTLVLYPKGNKKDSGSGYVSLYVAIDNSSLIAENQVVYADLRFYVFNKIAKKYFTIQDTDVWRFDVFKTMWGFSQLLPLDTFRDPRNGYLYDGDHCEFGVDVTIPHLFQKSELFSVTRNLPNPRFTWTIQRFSMMLKDYYLSDAFFMEGRSWNIKAYPKGRGAAEDKSLSLYLDLGQDETFRSYEKIYVRAKLRVLDQNQSNHIERQLDNWYNGPGYGAGYSWGYHEFLSLSHLRDSSKGFVLNDMLMVQVELEAVSSTNFLDF